MQNLEMFYHVDSGWMIERYLILYNCYSEHGLNVAEAIEKNDFINEKYYKSIYR